MSAADPATLAAIQRATKRCLAETDRVCALLDLRYIAYGGTAIGAVRHQGFIPWDDDGEVCMPRADYERFIAEAPALLGDEFFIASPATHPNYPISFGVLGLKGSEFVSKVAKDRSFRMPIGVDLFVLDEIADDPGRFRAHWGMRALRAALMGRENPQKEADGSILFGDFSTRDPLRWNATEAELFPARSVPFEDITVRIPAAYDVVLTRGYGDYMRIPEPEDRVTHEPVPIVFGPNDPRPEATEEAGA